jgi:GntR family transcriptional regulator
VVGVGEAAQPRLTLSAIKRARVRAHLLDLIEEGNAGEAIPAERALSAQLQVSRPTLRSVVDDLVRDGALIRRHGSGVFIARENIAQNLVQYDGASNVVSSVDGTWSSEVIGFDVVAAGARVGQRLRIAPRDEIVRIQRLRSVDGDPMCVEIIHLPQRLVPGLEPDDLAGTSLYALLRRRFEILVAHAVQIIEPTVTDEDEAALLGVPAHVPALLFERTTLDADKRTVEFTHSIYRGDRYRIVSRLELGPEASAVNG